MNIFSDKEKTDLEACRELQNKERIKWCFKLWSVVMASLITGLGSLVLAFYIAKNTDFKVGIAAFFAIACAYYRRALEEYYEREYKQKYLNDRNKKSS